MTKFELLVNQALQSGKLSERSAKGLQNLLDVRLNRHKSREIDLYAEVNEILERPNSKLPVIPDENLELFNTLLNIYSILHPDNSESNRRSATFDAIDNIQPSQDDLKEIFNSETKIKYYSLEHLNHMLIYRSDLTLMSCEKDILAFCAKNISDGKPHVTAKKSANWTGFEAWNHIYYWQNQLLK